MAGIRESKLPRMAGARVIGASASARVTGVCSCAREALCKGAIYVVADVKTSDDEDLAHCFVCRQRVDYDEMMNDEQGKYLVCISCARAAPACSCKGSGVEPTDSGEWGDKCVQCMQDEEGDDDEERKT